jgi:hypothetical protein
MGFALSRGVGKSEGRVNKCNVLVYTASISPGNLAFWSMPGLNTVGYRPDIVTIPLCHVISTVCRVFACLIFPFSFSLLVFPVPRKAEV